MQVQAVWLRQDGRSGGPAKRTRRPPPQWHGRRCVQERVLSSLEEGRNLGYVRGCGLTCMYKVRGERQQCGSWCAGYRSKASERAITKAKIKRVRMNAFRFTFCSCFNSQSPRPMCHDVYVQRRGSHNRMTLGQSPCFQTRQQSMW